MFVCEKECVVRDEERGEERWQGGREDESCQVCWLDFVSLLQA